MVVTWKESRVNEIELFNHLLELIRFTYEKNYKSLIAMFKTIKLWK